MLPVFLSVFSAWIIFWMGALLLPAIFYLLRPAVRKLHPALAADLLFLLEMLPCAAALAVVSMFVLPEFSVWEPSHSSEGVPWFVIAVVMFGTAAFVRSVSLALRDLKRAREFASRGALIAVVGCLKPQVIVSAEARNLLGQRELRCVLEHERAHMTRQDNLRLFVCRMMERLMPLSSHWAPIREERLRQTELAADERAATSVQAALHLASALVKVANISTVEDRLLASTFAANHHGSLLTDRVHRLLNVKPSARLQLELAVDAAALLLASGAVLALACDARVQYALYRLLEKIVSA